MAAATADVVIVGGGVMGTSIALQLARRRAGRIVLLEKHHVASGPTGRSSAAPPRRHYSIGFFTRRCIGRAGARPTTTSKADQPPGRDHPLRR